MSSPSVTLRVMINKQKTKVLFAEANTDFINVLLSFLALPLGQVVNNHISLGSINSLHTGLSNMEESHFSVRGAKEMLLNPQNSFRAECRKLTVDITNSRPNNFYVCSDKECPKTDAYVNVSLYSDIYTCGCGCPLNREIRVGECLDGAFVTNPSSFIITDDLRVVPILTGVFQTLTNLGITDTQGAEMKSLMLDKYEIRDLFRICLTSATPLTDIVLKKTGLGSASAKPEPGINLLRHIPKEKVHSRQMALHILRASLTSKTPLSDVLIKPMLNKPKQET